MATIYRTATTLDGYIATAQHSLDWLFAVPGDDDAGEHDQAATPAVGAAAMGGSSYRWLREHAPDWRPDEPTWVFSRHETQVPEGADVRFVSGPVMAVHAAMVAAAGEQDVWLVGGGDLVGQFADAGLLDRIETTIVPVTLGAGAPLLPRDLRSDRLHLVDVRRAGQMVTLTYDVGS